MAVNKRKDTPGANSLAHELGAAFPRRGMNVNHGPLNAYGL